MKIFSCVTYLGISRGQLHKTLITHILKEDEYFEKQHRKEDAENDVLTIKIWLNSPDKEIRC